MKKFSMSVLCVASVLAMPGCVIVVDQDGAEFLSAWSDDEGAGGRLRGSGVARSEVRVVDPFHSIALNGLSDVRVTVGGEQTVRVNCDDNLIAKLETRVENGVLSIQFEKGDYRFRVDPRVEISVPALDDLHVSGSGNAEITGVVGDKLGLGIAGSGDITAHGTVDELCVAISGSGDMDLYGLAARRVTASIAGSGDIEVSASETLQATISGSGDIRYRGAPTVEKHIAGSGSCTEPGSSVNYSR